MSRGAFSGFGAINLIAESDQFALRQQLS